MNQSITELHYLIEDGNDVDLNDINKIITCLQFQTNYLNRQRLIITRGLILKTYYVDMKADIITSVTIIYSIIASIWDKINNISIPENNNLIGRIKNSLASLQSQINSITVADFRHDINWLRNSIASFQDQMNGIVVYPYFTNGIYPDSFSKLYLAARKAQQYMK
jgi:hypothetical protein